MRAQPGYLLQLNSPNLLTQTAGFLKKATTTEFSIWISRLMVFPIHKTGAVATEKAGSNKMTLFDGGDLKHVLFARSCRLSRNNGKEVILQIERAYAI